MSKSKQTIQSSKARGEMKQVSGSENADQLIHDSEAEKMKQVVVPSFDLAALASELGQLRIVMKAETSSAEDDVAIGEIAAAEKAASEADEPSALDHLKKAGRWALGVAERIGLPVAVAALKASLGL